MDSQNSNTNDPSETVAVPKPPSEKKKEGAFSKIVSVFKSISSILSSTVRIFFAIIGLIFLISIIAQIASTSDDGTVAYRNVLLSGDPETVAVLDFNGTILDVVPQGPFDIVTETQLITPRRVIKLLEKIKKDPNIKAVVFRINSPGGSVTASEEIYQTINRFRNETQIPVIVSQGEIAASGGYYISLAGDVIMADATTLTGSIGVIASMINVQELASEHGVREIAITSGENKNFFSPFQELDEEEQSIMQSIVDDAYEQFIARVRESRDISEIALRAAADGRPMTGKQAQEAQLIDQLGTFYDAVELAREEAGVPNAQVVEYTDRGVLESLLGAVSKPLISKLPFSFLDPYTQLSGKPAYLYGGM